MSPFCQIGELLCGASAHYYRNIVLSKTLCDQHCNGEALALMKASAIKLNSDLKLVLAIITTSGLALPERLQKRVQLSLEAILREIKNAEEVNTVFGYYDVLSFHIISGAEPNLLENLAVECVSLQGECLKCEICIRCPRCGSQGNGNCKLEPNKHALCLNSPEP